MISHTSQGARIVPKEKGGAHEAVPILDASSPPLAGGEFAGKSTVNGRFSYKFPESLFSAHGLTLFLCGLSSLANFNAIIMLFNYYDGIFGGDGSTSPFSVRCQLVLAAGQLLATVAMLVYPTFDVVSGVYTAYIAQCVLAILMGAVSAQAVSFPFAEQVLLSFAFLQHAFAALAMNGIMGFSSVLSGRLTAHVSLGLGLEGMIAAAVSAATVMMAGLYHTLAVWSVTLLINVTALVAFSLVLSFPNVRRVIARAKAEAEDSRHVRNSVSDDEFEFRHGADAARGGAGAGGAAAGGGLVLRNADLVLASWLCIAVLFTVFPAKCVGLRPEPRFTPWILGMQNFGELIGRGGVSLGAAGGAGACVLISLLRIGFIFAFAAALRLPLDSLLRSPWALTFLMLAQAASFGFVASSIMGAGAAREKREKDRQTLAVVMTSAMLLGVPSGSVIMWLLDRYTSIFPPVAAVAVPALEAVLDTAAAAAAPAAAAPALTGAAGL